MPAPIFVLLIVGVALTLVAALVAVLAARSALSQSAICSQYASELAVQLRKTKQLENQVSELDDAWQKSLDQLKRLRSRYGMRDLRERMNDSEEDERKLRGAAWKEKMRAKLKLGHGSPTQTSIFGEPSEG